jgi:hypothetical protein
MSKNLALFIIAAFCFVQLQAQDGPPANWFNLDKEMDGVYGVSTEKAYEKLLKGKDSKTVIVAVIDSGIDADHEDMKDVMWVNTDEIPGNGIDDDNNGYIDDIHGWNFIGGADGSNVGPDTYEVTRVYKKYKYKFENGADPDKMTKSMLKEYELYLETKEVVEEKIASAEKNLKRFQEREGVLMEALDALKMAVGNNEMTDSLLALTR